MCLCHVASYRAENKLITHTHTHTHTERHTYMLQWTEWQGSNAAQWQDTCLMVLHWFNLDAMRHSSGSYTCPAANVANANERAL